MTQSRRRRTRGPRAPGTAHDRCAAPSGAVDGLCAATAIGLAVGRAAEDVQLVVKGSPAPAPWTGDDFLTAVEAFDITLTVGGTPSHQYA